MAMFIGDSKAYSDILGPSKQIICQVKGFRITYEEKIIGEWKLSVRLPDKKAN
jgi:hypothetical protein